nr:hypothetical protein [Tanacetum cinerariifolium]GFB42773.1 hypothetical protein [Tanacetum cinerariifolium]
ICIGWDPMVVKVVVIHESRQSILCEVENMALSLYKRIAGTKSWMLMWDFNVTLKPIKHSPGSSSLRNFNNGILKKLDRVMINEAFIKKFGQAHGEAKLVHHLSYIGEIIKTKLNMEEASNMIANVTDKEIKAAMFDIDNNKALGPDGFSSCFFKKAWEFIWKDVCNSIK